MSAVSLFFFMWSFAGLRDVALAAKNGVDTPALKQERMAKELAVRGNRPEAKLEKAVGDIERIVKDYGKKISADERQTAKEELKLKKQEIQALDVEMKKQFAETEQRIIKKKLSPKKLQLHRDFVKKFEADFAALNRRLEAVEKAATVVEIDQQIELFRNYIKSVKVEKKRPKIDFDNLPHRNAEPTKLQPRLKKEEFQPILKAELLSIDHIYSILYPGRDLAEDGYHPVANNEPVRVAALGPLTDLDFGEQSYDLTAQAPESDMNFESPILLAAASDLPSAEDLTETIDIQLTDAIRAKAAELNHDPLKIYEWVRNNIEFAPTWGSIQGADYCLQTELCNSFDTASLLIALLRASDIPARYVHGTIELPIEKAMNWAGDFTAPSAALQFMSAGGIPTGQVVEGGKITRAHFEHVWVEAWIDYLPSRGARHKKGQGDMWIPLDGSYKQYAYTQGLDIASEVPFDAESFVNQLTSTATINQEQGYVTGVDSAYVQQTMTDFQSQVENYISTNYPDATVGDILGTKEIKAENYPYLLGTLPYKRVVTGVKYSNLPDNLRHRWSMNIAGYAPISYSATLPELAGKKITLSYSPATPEDEAVVESYLPEPHEDGTPIDPSELPSSLPAYLINLKPELRIDGVVMASGGSLMMGTTEDFYMNFYFPYKGTTPVHNTIDAGDYAGIALDLGRVSSEQVKKYSDKIKSTKIKMENEQLVDITGDNLIGDLLFKTALNYYAAYDIIDYISSKTTHVNSVRLPSESMFYSAMKFSYSFFSNRPISAGVGGLVMDVDYNTVVARSMDGSHSKMINFMRVSGFISSTLEHSVPEQLFSGTNAKAEGISAVKALSIANEQGMPIYTINQNNLNNILPDLQLDDDVVADIKSAVSSGKEVSVSKSNITVNDWTGCGYIVFDHDTGSGVYMISGGLNGMIMKFICWSVIFLLVATLAGPTLARWVWVTLFGSYFGSVCSWTIDHYVMGDDSMPDDAKHKLLMVLDIVVQLSIGAGIFAAGFAMATLGIGLMPMILLLLMLYIPLALFSFTMLHTNLMFRKEYLNNIIMV
jgi:hypothetical protein